MKSKVDQLNQLGVDKLVAVSVNLKSWFKKFNNVVKKIVYNEFVKKDNATDTSELLAKQIMMLRSKMLKVKYLVLLA